MKFTKMHGCGNDYVYVNGFEENIADEAKAAIIVSDRHFGIGADGLIIIKPSDIADFEMVMYNADGSRGAMCGNGVRCVAKYVYDHKLTDKTSISVASMGPHAVVFTDIPVSEFPLEKIGPKFENNPVFPDRVNTEFVNITDRKNLNMRVWERGSGETLACGTGTCATVVAAILNGYVDNDVTVHLIGGDLKISWSGNEADSVFMTGPAETVFSGEIDL